MASSKLERQYEKELTKKLKVMFPGCFIQSNPPEHTQGIPDLTIFFEDQWAMLEVKASKNAPSRPNQPYYIEQMNSMSFAAFIYPENEEEVLRALQQTFRSRR